MHEGLAKMSRIDHTERLSEFLDVCEELYGQEEWERFLTDKRLDRVCSGKILKHVHRAGTQLTWAINIVLLVCWQYNRVPHMPVFQNTDVEDFRLTLRIPDMLRQAAFLKDDAVSEMVRFGPRPLTLNLTPLLHSATTTTTTSNAATDLSFDPLDYNRNFCPAEPRPVGMLHGLLH